EQPPPFRLLPNEITRQEFLSTLQWNCEPCTNSPLSANCFDITHMPPTCLRGSILLYAHDSNFKALYLNYEQLAIGNFPGISPGWYNS
ncbi:MAG TPA: hypothetical protein VJ761_08250, partial [Ktedonobacteraceae bacterium]|nr:hypothetical protein [Ktedonobacteraceae bacterium]